MENLRTMLPQYSYPYPHQHSRHAIISIVFGCCFFVSFENMNTLIQGLENNITWWFMYIYIIGFFYFFSSPFLGKRIKPSYSTFSKWYIAWIFVAAVYHLPSFQSMGVDLRMNLSLFITIYATSILFLIVFHVIFAGLCRLGLVGHRSGHRLVIWTIIQNCTVISVACCVVYSHCGNRAITKERKSSNWLSLWNEERNSWLAKFLETNELINQVCSSWFAPVGSARDYPLMSKWVIYGELACSGTCAESPDEISPIYSLWATCIGLYIANHVVERSTGWALANPVSTEETREPEFEDMVPWYSGTSADLYKTFFDLLVSVTMFLGRFDMRMMQAAMNTTQDAERGDFLYDHFKDQDDFWFDFMADTGDGGNSSYTVARLLAQPELTRLQDSEEKPLRRGNLLLIGGDLAYPHPSKYEERLFRPFCYALHPPSDYKEEHIAINKPELPNGVSDLKHYDGPQCFIIPGNHDWFDGLQSFMRYICHRSWLGGWLMPQKKSYFALQLPKGWWVFGLDLALQGDIDVYQFKFFSELIEDKIEDSDSIIIMTHEPNWLLDSAAKNMTYLIRDHLKGRCKLRMAGDLHHYMRHSSVPSSRDKPVYVHHLLVNGCGGAFLHPTHVFSNFKEASTKEALYELKVAYPSCKDSSKIALGNILKFRKMNWQFDFIGGIIYFVLAFSMFPQCQLNHLLREDSFSGHLRSFLATVLDSLSYMLEHSYVSFVGMVVLLIIAISFVPSKVSCKRRVVIGILHVSAHVSAALILMLLLELGVEMCIRHELLATSGHHTLYKWYKKMERKHFPDPNGLRARVEQWTLGLYPACFKYLMFVFDIPEVMAVTRSHICKNGIQSLSRAYAAIYYTSVFLYYWVFATPVVSLIFGCYLYICINWLHIHFDEAFSSLRIANYKAFTRFHITSTGDLEVFTVAVDKVPTKWKLDSNWNELPQLSHRKSHPSKYIARDINQDPLSTARIVDQFFITKTQPSDLTSNG